MSTKPKKPRTVKARKMWSPADGGDLHFIAGWEHSPFHRPIAVLDISEPGVLVEQVAKALCEANGSLPWEREPQKNIFTDHARAVLQSLGILSKPRTAKRKKPIRPVEFENAELGDEG